MNQRSSGYSKDSLSIGINLKASEVLNEEHTIPSYSERPYNWNGFLRGAKSDFFEMSKNQIKVLTRCQALIGSSFFENAGVTHISPAQMTGLFSKIEKEMNGAFDSWYYGKGMYRDIEIRGRVKRKSKETLTAEDAKNC